ncbi:MAG: cell division protein ZapA [Alphaproteobacteria bacterium]|nr:cell division protein ZapA [Alphaproteobacteria bacterium]
MALVVLEINNEKYKITCPDGQEETLKKIGVHLNEKAELLKKRMGYIPDNQLLVMLGVMAVQESFLVEKKFTEKMKTEAVGAEHLERIKNLSLRIRKLAQRLKKE